MAPPYCTYHIFTGCCSSKEFEPWKGLRDCHKCGANGWHHHHCAAGKEFEIISAVPNSTSTLRAVCCGAGTAPTSAPPHATSLSPTQDAGGDGSSDRTNRNAKNADEASGGVGLGASVQ
eukprot:3209974-Pleurochrysis_carterae.AAC.1